MSRTPPVLLAVAPVIVALVLACFGGPAANGPAADGQGSSGAGWTSPGAAFSAWTVPGEVATRLQRDGWAPVPDDCEADDRGDLTCYATRGDAVARVRWTTYAAAAGSRWEDRLDHGEIGGGDGTVVLSVRVADNPTSLEAAKALLAEPIDLTTQDQAAIRSRLESAGYGQIACDDDGETQDQCTGVKGDERVRLTVGREPDPESVAWEFDTDPDNGGAYLYDQSGWAKATVYSVAQGKALIAVLLAN